MDLLAISFLSKHRSLRIAVLVGIGKQQEYLAAAAYKQVQSGDGGVACVLLYSCDYSVWIW